MCVCCVAASGVVLDTCGWVRDMGYELLTHTAVAFAADIILVIGS